MPLFACLLLVWTAPSSATEDDLRRYKRYEDWKVVSFELQGVPKEHVGALRRGLALAGRWKLTGIKRPSFSLELLGEDIERIKLYLAQHGHPAAAVAVATTTDEKKKQIGLVLKVTTRAPVRVQRNEAIGWPEGVAWPDDSQEQLLQEGQIFQDEALLASETFLRIVLLDSGYALSEISTELRTVGTRGAPGVIVVYNVVPGDVFTIETIQIEGCSEDLKGLARRILNIKPGQPYSHALMRTRATDLRTTQLFGSVELLTEPIAPGKLALTVKLANGRMRSLQAAVGTWTDNPWMVRAGWTHRNLFKNGVGFDTRGTFGTYELTVRVSVFWLGWLNPRAQTRAGTGYYDEDEDAYRSQEYRLEFVQSFRPRARDIFNLGIALSDVNLIEYSNEYDENRPDEGRLVEYWLESKWDRTDDPIFPTRNGYFKIYAVVSPAGVFSESPYVLLQGDAVRYPLRVGPVITAIRARLGWAQPLGDNASVLPNRRFYAGGFNTMRGYERRRLGPYDDDNNPIGGEFTILAGAEVRFPLFWILDGALFVDSGQVWSKTADVDLSELAVAVGAEIDFRTPIGPMRIGYAHNVANLITGEPEGLFHFGIGYPW